MAPETVGIDCERGLLPQLTCGLVAIDILNAGHFRAVYQLDRKDTGLSSLDVAGIPPSCP